MALPDLTGQNIEDTYQRLLQKSSFGVVLTPEGPSGNITDGTGSVFIPKSAITASFIGSIDGGSF